MEGDRPISPGSPWQNGYAERLIGTVRHECLDRMLIFGESHLRRVLASYTAYYNQARTHLALQKDAPLHRAVQRSDVIVAIPILAGTRVPLLVRRRQRRRALGFGFNRSLFALDVALSLIKNLANRSGASRCPVAGRKAQRLS